MLPWCTRGEKTYRSEALNGALQSLGKWRLKNPEPGRCGLPSSLQKAHKRDQEGGFSELGRRRFRPGLVSVCERERGRGRASLSHGEILNRDPWWLTERGGCLFRQQPHGTLGAEATVENPHAKRPVHATKSRLSVWGVRAKQWLCVK